MVVWLYWGCGGWGCDRRSGNQHSLRGTLGSLRAVHMYQDEQPSQKYRVVFFLFLVAQSNRPLDVGQQYIQVFIN